MRKGLIVEDSEAILMSEEENIWKAACDDAVSILSMADSIGATPMRLFLALAIIVAAVTVPVDDKSFKKICEAFLRDTAMIRETMKRLKEMGLVERFRGGDFLV